MAFSQYVVVFVILIPGNNTVYKTINLIIFELFSFLAIASHLRTMFTNPVNTHKQIYLTQTICLTLTIETH